MISRIRFVFILCHVMSVLSFTCGLHTNGRYWQKSVRNLCEEVSSFTPNFCSYPSAQQYCSELCDRRNNQDVLTCGRKPKSNKQVLSRSRRVVGGQTSEEGEWPWHVSLRINGTQWCGGSILSERFILTAAHCFDEQITSLKPEDWDIYAGDHALHTKDRWEQRVKVKNFYIHDEYKLYLHQHRRGSWVTAENDIAIMELASPISLSHQNKGQICLPDNNRPIKFGSHCHVIGWGITSYGGKQPDHLNHAVVMVIPTKICNLEMAYNHTINGRYLLCAGYEKGGIDSCNYDSGGALACVNEKGSWHATGIVSSGYECARPNAYGLYTRISTDKEWIIDTLLKSGKMQNYRDAWPLV